MKTEEISQQSQCRQDARGASASSAAQPDVNFETYPFDLVQYLLDQVAHLSMFAIPTQSTLRLPTLIPDDPDDWFGLNGGYGLAIRSALHRFDSTAYLVQWGSKGCPGCWGSRRCFQLPLAALS